MKQEFSKPNIVISKCIEHGHCRFDGSQINDNFVKKLEPYVNFIPICPEVEIGLSIPRESIRIIKQKEAEYLVFSKTGLDVTNAMNDFTKAFLHNLKDQNIHGFILKSRSPSCGIKDVKQYKTYGKSPSIGKTSGFFGRAVLSKFNGWAIEDEGRLTNHNIREKFLTHIFVLSAFNLVMQSKKYSDLIKFHSNNKYLLMAYNQTNQNKLGKIVANHEKRPIEDVVIDYYNTLKTSFSSPLSSGRNINMLMHLFGYFKKEINVEEKAYFLETLEQYSSRKIPFRVPLSIIYAWVIRFNHTYLKSQTIFNPFPEAILDVSDSGKGIN